MDFKDASKIIKSIPMLEGLSSANRKLLAFTSQLLTYEDGEVVFHIDEPATYVYIVVEGQVDQIVVNSNDEVHAGTVTKNKLFGEMAVIQNVPRLVTVRAKGPVNVLRIEGEMFLQMVTTSPKSALAVMQEMAQKITTLVDKHKDK
ncbi:MAG: cyclic nucleotide-binding domain-containing protein [Magnetovibrio sp.]|nr:cyclic nucleotide-binding domain-containing protein [Magnetovibrio sp.]